MIDLNKFVEWQKEKPNRAVSIDIDNKHNDLYPDGIKIWVWDYDLMVGQHVTTTKDIDLETTAKTKMAATVIEYRKRYGEEI